MQETICKECNCIFTKKYKWQTMCTECYYTLNPDKDFINIQRNRIRSHLGIKPLNNHTKKPNRLYADYSPTDETKGISDDELINDENYIHNATKNNDYSHPTHQKPNKQQKGYSAPSKSRLRFLKKTANFTVTYQEIEEGRKLQVGDILPDGSVFLGQRSIEEVGQKKTKWLGSYPAQPKGNVFQNNLIATKS